MSTFAEMLEQELKREQQKPRRPKEKSMKHVKTWHIEWFVIGLLLVGVAHFTRGIDMNVGLWLVATLMSHGIRSISSRQQEAYEAASLVTEMQRHQVKCFAWAGRYSLVLSILGAYVALERREWHGMVALAVGLAWPYYRRLYRKRHPLTIASY